MQRVFVCFLYALVGTVQYAVAQEVVTTIPSTSDCYLPSATVQLIDDITGDGQAEIALSAPSTDVGAFVDAGATTICDGADGSLLFRYEGDSDDCELGTAVAALGDVNDDGVADFAISDQRSTILNDKVGRVSLYSGADGSLIYFRSVLVDFAYFGAAIAGVGDINSNGTPDWATFGGLGSQNEGLVYLYDGSSGTVIRTLRAADLQRSFGKDRIVNLGDVNSDGINDLAISSTGAFVDPDMDSAGRVDVISGADGSTLHSVEGIQTDGCLGGILKPLGDVSGDGIIDFGATCDEMKELMIVSGADASVLTTFSSEDYNSTLFAYDTSAVGDLNGDGIGDLVVTSRGYRNASNEEVGRLYFYLGGDFSLFGTIEGSVDASLGTYVLYAGEASDGAQQLAIRIAGQPAILKLVDNAPQDPEDPDSGGGLFPSAFSVSSRVTKNGVVVIELNYIDNWSGCSFQVSAANTRRAREESRGRQIIATTGRNAQLQSVLRATRVPGIAKAPQKRKLFARVNASCNAVHTVSSDFELDFARNRRAALRKGQVIRTLSRTLRDRTQ